MGECLIIRRGGKPEEEKTVTAGTSAVTVNPTSGKTMKKVTVNPTPSQSKSATPSTSAQTISPDSGKLLSSVSISAIQTETKTVTAGTSATTTTPTSGKYLTSVTINPTPSQTKSATPTTSQQTISPDSGKLLSSVTVGAISTETKTVTAGTSASTVTPTSGKYLTKVTVNPTPSEEQTVEWTGSTMVITPASGKYLSKVTIEKPFDPSTVTWAGGSAADIVKMVAKADAGEITLSDYWAVGDTRRITLSAMAATGVGELHEEQEVDLVLLHAGDYKLNSAVSSGRTTCSFVVGLKDCLAETGYMNSSNTNSGSWNGSLRRAWCNSVFKNAMPSDLVGIFKQFKTITANPYNGTTLETTVDYFALPAEREIFGADYGYSGDGYANNTEAASTDIFQFAYYQIAANRIKNLGIGGSAYFWWERSPRYNYSDYFCLVHSDGNAADYSASYSYGLAPFGCI